MLLAFTCLFVLAFAMMNQKKNDSNIVMKAEYLITVSWPNHLDDDVDVYIEDPYGTIVFFQSREGGLMHLDRDDTGKLNDFINTPAGVATYNENREIVTLRGFSPGEYTLNVHMYRRNMHKSPATPPPTEPCPVTVQMDKLNPYSTVLLKTVELMNNGDEVTVTRFTLDNKGNVVSMDQTPKQFVGPANQRGYQR